MKWIFYILLIIIPISGYSQVVDNFSDGDFSYNPTWLGDTNHFEINSSKQLHLKNTVSDISYLSTPNIASSQCEWHFWAKLSLNSSINNFARVYLTSSNSDLSDTLKGYFVQLGGIDDSVSLCYQNGLNIKEILKSKSLYFGNSVNSASIKITRNLQGEWSLFSDSTGFQIYKKEASAIDNSYLGSSFFGVYCKYTSSNATKFYFDDFYVGDIIIDTISPKIESLDIINDSTINIAFNEVIQQAEAVNIQNFSLNILGFPKFISFDSTSYKNMSLSFESKLASGVNYALQIRNIKDLSENIIKDTTINFLYYLPLANDIVINEVMADPDPPFGLPNYEYLELLNTTNFPISINRWNLEIGSNTKILPNVNIPPMGYLIVCHENGIQELQKYGNAIGLSSFQLTNTGTSILLKDANNRLVSAVKYSDDWYQDNIKADGGWSLELIDPTNPCGGYTNWKASISSKGGTPGTINSVYSVNADKHGPEFLRASIFDYFTVQLHFSEPIDTFLLLNPNNYLIDNGVGKPTSVTVFDDTYASVLLSFPSIIKFNQIYSVTVSNSIADCAGNVLQGNNIARFAIPIPADSNDLVINEILFNPKLNGVDFVELYNRSDKVIDLSELRVASFDSVDNKFVDVCSITNGFLVFPGNYVVLSTNAASINSQFPSVNSNANLQITTLPSLNNDAGNVFIINNSMEIIDGFAYTESMHYPLLNSFEGVSLERVNPNRDVNDKGNWHSAAENVGFGTPTLKNSQYFETSKSDANINIEPQLFSPDNDGYNDQLNISLKFLAPGYSFSLIIYDADGRLVRHLTENKLGGEAEIVSWDGLNDAKEKCNIGSYIVYFEAFNLKGDIQKKKLVVVLGGRI